MPPAEVVTRRIPQQLGAPGGAPARDFPTQRDAPPVGRLRARLSARLGRRMLPRPSVIFKRRPERACGAPPPPSRKRPPTWRLVGEPRAVLSSRSEVACPVSPPPRLDE